MEKRGKGIEGREEKRGKGIEGREEREEEGVREEEGSGGRRGEGRRGD